MRPTNQQSILEQESVLARRIARKTAPEALAEDVAQQTLLAAIQKGPEDAAQRRNWIAVAARRIALNAWRSESDRRHRESQYVRAANPIGPAGAKINHEGLSMALKRLDGPSLELLDLHYNEGLSLTAIAEDLGCPPETIRSRHHRILRRLRTEMGVRPRERSRAFLPLLPFRRRSGVRIQPAMGILAVVAASIAALVLTRSPEPEGPGNAVVRMADAATDSNTTLLEAPATERAPLPSAPTPPRGLGLVRVTDRSGKPHIGAAIHALLHPTRNETTIVGTTDANGEAHIPVDLPFLFACTADGIRSRVQYHPGADAEDGLTLVSANQHGVPERIEGRVTDAEGQPIPGVRIATAVRDAYELGRTTDFRLTRQSPPPRARTDADGRYVLMLPPRGPYNQVNAFIAGRGRSFRSRDELRGGNTDFVLGPLEGPAPSGREIQLSGETSKAAIRVTLVESRPREVDPEALLRGWTSSRHELSINPNGILRIPPSTPRGTVALLSSVVNGRSVILDRATASDAPPIWKVEPETIAVGSAVGTLPERSAVYLVSERLVEPIRVTAEARDGSFRVDGIPLGESKLVIFREGERKPAQYPLTLDHPNQIVHVQLAVEYEQRVPFQLDLLPNDAAKWRVRVLGPGGSRRAFVAGATGGSSEGDVFREDGSGQLLVRTPGRYLLMFEDRNGVQGHASFSFDPDRPLPGPLNVELRESPRVRIELPVDSQESGIRLAMLGSDQRVLWETPPRNRDTIARRGIYLPADATSIRMTLLDGTTQDLDLTPGEGGESGAVLRAIPRSAGSAPKSSEVAARAPAEAER